MWPSEIFLFEPPAPSCQSSPCWLSSPPGQRTCICQISYADGAVTQPCSHLRCVCSPLPGPSRMPSTACWENWGASGLRIHNGLENSGEWLVNNMGRCANLSTPPKARDPPAPFPPTVSFHDKTSAPNPLLLNPRRANCLPTMASRPQNIGIKAIEIYTPSQVRAGACPCARARCHSLCRHR